MWHKKCFNCAECHRPLDSVLACDGPDREIHCRACYGKLFGPKGFGFGHAPTLVCVDGLAPVIHDPRPNSGPKAAAGKGCRRCGYSVFAAEQMISKNGIWHKRCFSCSDCNRSLDSTTLNDGPNGEIYCRGKLSFTPNLGGKLYNRSDFPHIFFDISILFFFFLMHTLVLVLIFSMCCSL